MYAHYYIVAARFAEGSLDQPTGEHVGEQKQSSLIFFNECPKVVDRFREAVVN